MKQHKHWKKHNKYQQASFWDGELQVETSARWAGSLLGVEVELSKKWKKRMFGAIAHATPNVAVLRMTTPSLLARSHFTQGFCSRILKTTHTTFAGTTQWPISSHFIQVGGVACVSEGFSDSNKKMGRFPQGGFSYVKRVIGNRNWKRKEPRMGM